MSESKHTLDKPWFVAGSGDPIYWAVRRAVRIVTDKRFYWKGPFGAENHQRLAEVRAAFRTEAAAKAAVADIERVYVDFEPRRQALIDAYANAREGLRLLDQERRAAALQAIAKAEGRAP